MEKIREQLLRLCGVEQNTEGKCKNCGWKGKVSEMTNETRFGARPLGLGCPKCREIILGTKTYIP